MLEYRSSASATVMACCPERDFKPWMFVVSPKGLWEDRKVRRQYMKWLVRGWATAASTTGIG